MRFPQLNWQRSKETGSVLNETGAMKMGITVVTDPWNLMCIINRGASLQENNLVSEASFSNFSHKTQTQQYKWIDFGNIDAIHLSGTM